MFSIEDGLYLSRKFSRGGLKGGTVGISRLINVLKK